MTEFVLIGASCEAEGHPTSCEEPASGSVSSSSNQSVSINGTEVATVDTADLSFGSHAHAYESPGPEQPPECTDFFSHTLDPYTASSSVTINGSPLYLKGDNVATDPGTGGSINITTTGSNSSVTES